MRYVRRKRGIVWYEFSWWHIFPTSLLLTAPGLTKYQRKRFLKAGGRNKGISCIYCWRPLPEVLHDFPPSPSITSFIWICLPWHVCHGHQKEWQRWLRGGCYVLAGSLVKAFEACQVQPQSCILMLASSDLPDTRIGSCCQQVISRIAYA